jgi:hypothetical protein
VARAQLKQLFGFCGTVTKCDLVGEQLQLAMVEYATPTVRASMSEHNAVAAYDVAHQPLLCCLARCALRLRESDKTGMLAVCCAHVVQPTAKRHRAMCNTAATQQVRRGGLCRRPMRGWRCTA